MVVQTAGWTKGLTDRPRPLSRTEGGRCARTALDRAPCTQKKGTAALLRAKQKRRDFCALSVFGFSLLYQALHLAGTKATGTDADGARASVNHHTCALEVGDPGDDGFLRLEWLTWLPALVPFCKSHHSLTCLTPPSHHKHWYHTTTPLFCKQNGNFFAKKSAKQVKPLPIDFAMRLYNMCTDAPSETTNRRIVQMAASIKTNSVRLR